MTPDEAARFWFVYNTMFRNRGGNNARQTPLPFDQYLGGTAEPGLGTLGHLGNMPFTGGLDDGLDFMGVRGFFLGQIGIAPRHGGY